MSMKEKERRLVHDVIDQAVHAMQGNEPALLSHTLYGFNLVDGTLNIADFDILVMPHSVQCVHTVNPFVLKTVRKGESAVRGSVFECVDAKLLEAVVSDPTQIQSAKRLECNEMERLREVRTPKLSLHAGRFLVFRLEYKTLLGEPHGRQHLMFSGAIQPSDYQGVLAALGISSFQARKIMEVSVYAQLPFSACFFDRQLNEFFPPADFSKEASHEHGGGQIVNKWFMHEMNRNTLRARYFSMLVNLPDKVRFKRRGKITDGVDELGIGA